MKLALHLNNMDYLYDYINMDVELFIVGGEYSSGGGFNLSIDEIKKVKEICQNRLVYVLVNGLYDEYELEGLESYLKQLNQCGVDGLLFQDFAVVMFVKEKNYHFDMMYSPETLNTNGMTLDALSYHGITSAFISRVIPIEEQLLIKEKTNIPLMIQGHGVEYIAASKRELLTTYKQETKKEFSDCVVLKPHHSDYECYIYEDNRGTHVYSCSRLYTLDLLNTLQGFDYLYIETLFMKDQEAIEVTSIYSDCLKAMRENKYNKEVKEYLPLLRKISPLLDRGFLFDQTVYRLEDMRKLDHERNQ